VARTAIADIMANTTRNRRPSEYPERESAIPSRPPGSMPRGSARSPRP